MKKGSVIVFLFILFSIVGCDGIQSAASDLDEWTCTEEQLKLVRVEFEICDASSFFSSYCFEQAKKSICDKIN